MDAAIVELDALADAVGSAAEDDDLLAFGGVGFADRRAVAAFVGGIHVGRGAGELRRAGVDTFVDRVHAEPGAQRGDFVLAVTGELRQVPVGEAERLDAAQRAGIVRQAGRGDRAFGVDDAFEFAQEPGIELAGVVDVLDREAGAQRLCRDQQPVGARFGERGTECVGAAVARRLDLVETGQPGLHAAQSLLQRLGEAAADRHRLADRFHRCREQGRRAGELLEGEARDLHHDIVDRRLEARRRDARDVVGEFVQRVADGKLRRDLGDREAGRLRCQRRGTRHARVHLDDDHAAIGRVHRELHVGAAGIDADRAQAGDRGVAHPLIFLVGQRERGRDGDGIAGVDAHRIDVLDRADDDAVVRAVADHLHLEFLPAEHGFLDQHLGGGRGFQAAGDDLFEFLAVVGDAAAGAAEGEAGADDGGQAGGGERGARFLQRMRDGGARRFDADRGHRIAELQPVLGAFDHLGAGADQFDVVACQRAGARKLHGGVERGLAAHGRQQRVGLLARDDAFDDLRRDRLDVGGVGETGIGHDGGGIGVHQHDAIALGLQRLARLRAGIVELAGLADDDRAGADDQDGGDVGAFGHWSVAVG